LVVSLKKRSKAPEAIRLQRFFSTFPGGQPGLGLLLLRVSLGTALIAYGVAWTTVERSWNVMLGPASILCGLLLLAGFLTPVVSVLICAGGAVGVVSRMFSFEGWASLEIFLVFIFAAVSIGLLGPGAYSVDAMIFGRREIIIPKRSHLPEE